MRGLDAIRESLGAVSFHQVTVDTGRNIVTDSVACAAIPDGKALEYEEHHVAYDERLPIIARLGQGQVMLDHEHLSARDMSRSAIYVDFLRSLGMRHTAAVVLRSEPQSREYLAILREAGSPAFDTGARELLEAIVPGLVQASRLRARSAELAHKTALGVAAVDCMPHAVIVVREDAAIVHANSAAERLFAIPGLCRTGAGRLALADADASAQLQQCIVRACDHQSREAGIVRVGHGRDAWLLSVLPLPMAGELPTARRHAMVMAKPLFGVSPMSPGRLAELLGVTLTESRLALMLAAGRTVRDFADAQRCSMNTARTHLRNLLAKTDSRRQLDLVQLVRAIGFGP